MNSGLNKFFIRFISVFITIFFSVITSYAEIEIISAASSVAKKNITEELIFIEGLLETEEYYTSLGYIKSLLTDNKIKEIYNITDHELSDLNIKAGTAYLEMGSDSNAEKSFKKSLSIDQNATGALQGLQKKYFLQKNYPLSLKYYDLMLSKTKFDKIPLQYHYISLISCFETQNNQKFEYISKKLPLKSNKEIFPYIQYTRALAATRKDIASGSVSPDTFAKFDQLISNKNYPSDFTEKTLLTKGMILFEDGRYDDSIKIFKTLDKTPIADDALYGIIWNYIKLEKHDYAFKEIDTFLNSYKESSHYEDILMLKGQLFKKIKNFEKSIASYEEAKKEFQKSAKLINNGMAKEKYTKRSSSLFEIADFSTFRYSPYFRYLKFKSSNSERYNEKRILKSVAGKSELYQSLSSLISVRKLMDARVKTQIKLQSFVNKYEYNLSQLKKIVKKFKKELSRLKKINMDGIKQQIEKKYSEGESTSTDISFFASKKEQVLLQEINSKVTGAKKFLNYVKSSSQIFKIADKSKFFKKIQKVMLSSPVFEAAPLGLKDKIITALAKAQADKRSKELTITPEDEQFIATMEKSNNKIRIVNKKINILLWDVGSIMFKGNEAQDTYWKGVHAKVKEAINEIAIVARKLKNDMSGIKSVMENSILTKVAIRKIDFKKRIEKLEKKRTRLDTSIKLLVMHIDSLIEEMKPLRDNMAEASKMIIWLERKSIIVLKKVSANLGKTFLNELKNKAKEYVMLIEEADYEIADSLFRSSTGR